MNEIYRRLELLEAVHSHGALDEKVQKVLSLHAEAEAENTHLRDLLLKRGSSNAFETPDRKPKGGQLSPGLDEVPMEGPGRCEAVGKHFGMLGDCEAANRGGELGGELGDCRSAKRGGKQGGQLSPEVLEKCRKAGRENGMRGKEWVVCVCGVFWREAHK